MSLQNQPTNTASSNYQNMTTEDRNLTAVYAANQRGPDTMETGKWSEHEVHGAEIKTPNAKLATCLCLAGLCFPLLHLVNVILFATSRVSLNAKIATFSLVLFIVQNTAWALYMNSTYSHHPRKDIFYYYFELFNHV